MTDRTPVSWGEEEERLRRQAETLTAFAVTWHGHKDWAPQLTDHITSYLLAARRAGAQENERLRGVLVAAREAIIRGWPLASKGPDDNADDWAAMQTLIQVDVALAARAPGPVRGEAEEREMLGVIFSAVSDFCSHTGNPNLDGSCEDCRSITQAVHAAITRAARATAAAEGDKCDG